VQVNPNNAPELISWAPQSSAPEVSLGGQIEFSVAAVDIDGDPLTYLCRVDGEEVSTGSGFVYEPTAPGIHTVSITVDDGLAVAEKGWQLQVVDGPVNNPPFIRAYEPATYDVVAWANDAVVFSVDGYDPDGDAIDITWYVDGAATGTGSTFPFTASPGEYGIEAVVSDGELIARHAWTLTLLDVSGALSGRLYDAVTRAPVPSVIVSIGGFESVSSVLGQFEFAGLPPDGEQLLVRDEAGPDFGAYFDYSMIHYESDGTYLEIFLLPNRPVDSAYYSDFHQFYRTMTDINGIPYPSGQRRWDLPVQVYIPPYEANGLDYRQTILSVLPGFDTILGRTVFEVVDAVPASGVSITYLDNIYADNYRVTEWSPDYFPENGLIQFRVTYGTGTAETFRGIIRHEFGHVLGLMHSADSRHLMVGGHAASRTTFTPVEEDVLRALYHIPRGHDNLRYLRD
jgi:hypothetical protein